MNKRLIYRNILLIRQFEAAGAAFSRAGIKVCPLKGMGLILSGLYSPSGRDMEDIDILVRKEEQSLAGAVLLEEGYSPVCSGEKGYYRKGEPAVIDIHTDILYAFPGQLDELWGRMTPSGSFFLMPDAEHFIYILFHALIQHGSLRETWLRDLEKLLGELDPDKVRKAASRYNLNEMLALYDSGLFPGSRPGLRGKYMKFMLSLPEFSDKGHFLRPFFAGGAGETAAFMKEFLFPSEDFMRRRYRIRPAGLMFYLRPLLLLAKLLKAPFLITSILNQRA